MYRLYKNDQPNTTNIGLLPVTFETDLHVLNYHFSIAFKIFSSETSQTCDEWITEDVDGVHCCSPSSTERRKSLCCNDIWKQNVKTIHVITV